MIYQRCSCSCGGTRTRKEGGRGCNRGTGRGPGWCVPLLSLACRSVYSPGCSVVLWGLFESAPLLGPSKAPAWPSLSRWVCDLGSSRLSAWASAHLLETRFVLFLHKHSGLPWRPRGTVGLNSHHASSRLPGRPAGLSRGQRSGSQAPRGGHWPGVAPPVSREGCLCLWSLCPILFLHL